MVEEEGYEADDIIASYAKVSAKNDFEVKIVSSDNLCRISSMNWIYLTSNITNFDFAILIE